MLNGGTGTDNRDANSDNDTMEEEEKGKHPLNTNDNGNLLVNAEDEDDENIAMISHGLKDDACINGRSLDGFLEDAYRQHSSFPSSSSMTSPFQGSSQSSGCLLFPRWKYWMIMLSLGISNSSDASEILCLSYIISDDTFIDNMLLGSSNWRGGMLAAAVFAGMLVGGLVVGTLGDWQGRRPMLLFGLLLNVTAGLLSACAPNVFLLTGLRMIAGVGIGATVPPLFTLVAELAPPSQRGLCVTFCASFWMVGSVFVALVAIAVLKKDDTEESDTNTSSNDSNMGYFVAWRLFALICAIPSALGAAMVYWLVPESPRFLALQQRFEEAAISANTLGAALHYHGSTLYRWEIEEHFGTACHADDNYHPSSPIIAEELEGGTGSFMARTKRWIHLAAADFFVSTSKLYTANLRQTTWPLQMAWFSLSFGSYGLMTWINTIFFAIHLEDVYFNALLFALANLPGNLFTAFLMDRVGRSNILVGSILSASLSLLLFAAFANTASEGMPPNTYGVVMSACSFQCFTIAAWNTIDVMTSELFPTTVRSTGMGVCAASGRIGALVAQFINGALVGRPVRLLVVASITLAIGATTPFLLPQKDMTGRAMADGFQTVGSLGQNFSKNETDGDQGEAFGEEGEDDDEKQAHDVTVSRRDASYSNGHGSYQRVVANGKDAGLII